MESTHGMYVLHNDILFILPQEKGLPSAGRPKSSLRAAWRSAVDRLGASARPQAGALASAAGASAGAVTRSRLPLSSWYSLRRAQRPCVPRTKAHSHSSSTSLRS